MPILRVGGDDQGRIRQDDRAFDPEVQKMWQKAQPPHRNDLRLKEDPLFFVMGRVSRAPFPVPFGKDVIVRQQKRRDDGVLLALQGLSSPRRFPIGDGLFGKGVDR